MFIKLIIQPNFKGGNMGKVIEFQILIAKTRKNFLRVVNDAVKDEVLTSTHGMYILALNDKEMTKSEMTDVLGFDKGNTTRVVNELERFGYLSRKEGPKSNANLYYLTEKGRVSANKIEKALTSNLKEVTQGIPEEHCKIFRDVYLKIIQNIDGCVKRKE